MRIILWVHGSLRSLVTVGDGPLEIEPGTTVLGLLHLIGLTKVASHALVIIDGRSARRGELLNHGAHVHVLMIMSGG